MSEKRRLSSPGLAATLIILFFVLDRFLSMGHLLPEFSVEDESWVREGALRMVKEGSLYPGTHKYPQPIFTATAAAYYAYYLGVNVKALPHFESWESFSHHRKNFQFPFATTIMLGRAMVAVIAALALWLFYVFARREFGALTSLTAMLFLATCPAYLFSTGMLKNDALLLIGIVLVLFASVRVFERGELVDYLLAGAAVGLCLAAKYHVPAVLPVLVAHGLRDRETGFSRSFQGKRWLIIFPAAIAVFFILSPFTFIDLRNSIEGVGTELLLQNRLNPLFRRSTENWWQAPVLFQFTSVFPLALGIPLYLVSLGGFLWKTGIRDRRKLVIWSYPAGFVGFMILTSELGLPHLYVPAVPFFCLFAAYLFRPWMNSSGLRRGAAVVVVGAIAAYNLVLFHSFLSIEEHVAKGPAIHMMETHEEGMSDLALVPYRPNPDIEWKMEFAPQFVLSQKFLENKDPDRILLHETIYHAYLDNPRLRDDPAAGRTVLLYLRMKSGETGYKEADLWKSVALKNSVYSSLMPDLRGIRAAIFVKKSDDSGSDDGPD